MSHVGVLQAAVISLHGDEEGNDRPRAYIAKRADAGIAANDIHEAIERELGSLYQLSGGIVLVDRFSINSVSAPYHVDLFKRGSHCSDSLAR